MPAFILAILLAFGGFSYDEEHDLHLSRTTVNYNSEERAIQITSHTFIDALELALWEDHGRDSLQICTRYEKETAEQFILEYLSENLMIDIDGRQLDFTFIGKEQSDDLMAVWCYLEAYEVSPFSEITISNSILTSQFDDQKNITLFQMDKEVVDQILFTTDKTNEKIKP